jgi:tripartite-type tricarboxylate transporter receptor subunit TctC
VEEMFMNQKKALFLAAGLSALLSVSGCGNGGTDDTAVGTDAANDYPTESISLIVPYAAGGPTDVVARGLAPCLEQELGQTMVVENKEGASGAVGMQALIQSEPDGHTLEVIASTAAVVSPLAQDVGYTKEDFQTLGAVTQYPYILAISANSPYKTSEEFFEAAEAKPGEIKIGTPGASSQGSVELQRLAEEHGVKLTTVPFDGNAKATTALLGDNVDGVFLVASEDVLAQVEAGKFRAVAVGSAERAGYLPDVPTLNELGYEKLTLATSYYGLAAPAGIPADVAETLEESLQACLEEPAVVEKLGENYVPDEFISGEELSQLFEEQREAYRPILSK